MIIWISCFLVLHFAPIPSNSIQYVNIFFVTMTTLVMPVVMRMGATMMTGGLIGHARFKAVVDRAMWMTGFINAVGGPSSGLILSCPSQELLMGFVRNVFSIAVIQILALGD